MEIELAKDAFKLAQQKQLIKNKILCADIKKEVINFSRYNCLFYKNLIILSIFIQIYLKNIIKNE